MAGRKWMIQKTQGDSQRNEDLEELFVFGYASKLFRDDEKAVYVDEGRHLIPWMGDSSHMIDRYDGRGHLYDLDKHDADNVRADKSVLSEEEQRIEALCDEERYMELRHDLLEKQMYEEEELKRLNEALNEDYAAVEFNYDYHHDQSHLSAEQQQAESSAFEEEEPYEVPPQLLPPDGIMVPSTLKIGAVLEKTADFISRQGAQMEIMIKMKQKDNPVFAFLEFSDDLNPYYKHVVKVIKAGKYKPKAQERRRTLSEDDRELHGDSYLHPSLSAALKQPIEGEISSQGFLDSVKQKLPAGQIANTPYARLVSQMSKHTQGRNSPVLAQKTATEPNQSQAPHTGSEYGPLAPPPIPPFMSQAAGGNHPPPPGVEPVQLPSDQPPPPGTVPPDPPLHSSRNSRSHSPIQPQMSSNEEGPQIIPPPPDLQPIIDKMASYVAKNGIEFEMVVKAKNDARFAFLHPWHVHYPYYAHKKDLFLQEMEPKPSEVKEEPEPSTSIAVSAATSNKGVSFSIRAKDQEQPSLGSRPSLLYESSDEEGEGSDKPASMDSEESNEAREVNRSVLNQAPVEKPEKPVPTIEEMERRMAEERLKDKLASAARDRLAQTSKESQLKAERKRKAAMFINMLKSSGSQATAVPAAGPPLTPSLPLVSDSKPQPVQTSEEMEQGPDFSPLGSRSNSPAPAPETFSVPPDNTSPSAQHAAPQHSHLKARSPPRMEHLFRKDRKSRSRSRSGSPIWRKKSMTPPSAYVRARRSPPKKINPNSRSRSPYKKRSKSKSPSRDFKQRRRSRSRSKSKMPKRSRSRSKSKSKTLSRRRSRSRSKSKIVVEPGSRERHSHRSKRSRSKSKSRSSKRSKSRSPSSKKKSRKDKARSRSGSPSKKKSKKDKDRSKAHSQSPSKKSHRDREKTSSRPHSPHRKKSKKDKDRKGKSRSRSRSPGRSSRKSRRNDEKRSQSPAYKKPKRPRSLSQSRSPSPVYSPVRTVKKTQEKKVQEKKDVSDEEHEVILIPGTPSPQRPEDVQDTAVSSTSEERETNDIDGEGGQAAAPSPQTSPARAAASLNDGKDENVGEENFEENSSATSDSGATNSPRSDTKVSKDLLSKVRAMLKASRQATVEDLEGSS